MPTLKWSAKSDFSKSKKYLRKLHTKKFQNLLMKYADLGVQALKEATPKDSGFTAESWYADVEIAETYGLIYWKNSHYNQGYPIAILIDIGHGTGTGGYVKPHPYIDKSLRPVMKDLNTAIRKEVQS